MSLLVDNPILNSPFEEPTRYWAYEEGQPVLFIDDSIEVFWFWENLNNKME
jgi:hypothetical protein